MVDGHAELEALQDGMVDAELLGPHGQCVAQVDAGWQHCGHQASLMEIDDRAGFHKGSLKTEDQHGLVSKARVGCAARVP